MRTFPPCAEIAISRTTRAPILLGLILFFVGLAAPSATITPSIAVNVNITKAAGQQNAGSIAVNPANPAELFTTTSDALHPAYRSSDGGGTWTAAGAGMPATCCKGAAAWDGFGNLFVVNRTPTYPSPTSSIVLYLSTDDGATFSPLQTISTGPPLVGEPSLDAAAGTVWVTWSDDGGSIKTRGADVFGLGAANIGAFASEETAAPAGTFGRHGDIAIGPGGQVVLTYLSSGAPCPCQILVYTDPDGLGPMGFSAPVTVSDVNVDAQDVIPAQTIDAKAQLAWDRTGGAHDGRLYVSYANESPDESNNTDVYVRFSDDEGATWSPAVKVNDDATTTSQFNPNVSVDQTTGNLAVTWHDTRGDAANRFAQFWGALSDDGGVSFGSSFQISTGTSDTAAGPVDSSSDFTGGELHATWADNSNRTADNPAGANSTFDWYTVAVTIPPPPACSLSYNVDYGVTPPSTTLAWTSQNATGLSIDHGIGAVTPVANGSVTFSPIVATTYTATASGPGGTAHCEIFVSSSPTGSSTLVWNSWNVIASDGGGGLILAPNPGSSPESAVIEYYESTNNGGVLKGSLFTDTGAFTPGAHPDTFNNVESYWGPGTGRVYPYAGTSTVNRGAGAGESNTPLPLGVRDMQVHPPNNGHLVVAAFKIPQGGTYRISNLGVRRVHNLGGTVGFHVFNPDRVEIATLQATANRAWVTSPTTYTLTDLHAGSYIYFAVDRGGDFAYDATEIAFTVTKPVVFPTPPPPPPVPSCSLTAHSPTPPGTVGTFLDWTSNDATSISIDHGIGPVTPVVGGSASFTAPASTTLYTATVNGPGGTGSCSDTLIVVPLQPFTWNSWEVFTQSGTPQAQVVGTGFGAGQPSPYFELAQVELYESTNNGGVAKGSLFSSFNPGSHPNSFNNLTAYWAPALGNVYPYAGKSTVNRGSDAGETNAPMPLGVSDLQLHPPNNLHFAVAAFRVPRNGTYTIFNLGVRRLSNLGGPVALRVFNAQQVELAMLQATTNRAWVTSANTYVVPNLTAGAYLYFAVDRAGDYGYDATEIAWTITTPVDSTPPPPNPSCTLTGPGAAVQAGVPAPLTWTSSNATSISIDHGVGVVMPVAGGSVNVTPASTTLYTATVNGPGGTASCNATVTILPPAAQPAWNSWDAVTQAGSPQGRITASATATVANLEFYESTNNGGVLKGVLLSGFTAGTHPEAFNNVQQYWGAGTGSVYPYAGKSTVNRGSGAGETNTPTPLAVRDLQLHPPNSLHYVVAAFQVPQNGTYTVSNLGVRRVHNLGGSATFHVLNSQQVEIATLTATNNRAWVTSPTTYTLPGLTTGAYVYFAVDRAGDYSYDATEVAWTVTRTGP